MALATASAILIIKNIAGFVYEYRKYFAIGVGIVLLIASVLFIRGCYYDHKENKTAEVLNDLKEKNLQAEQNAATKTSDVNATKVEAEKKVQKAENLKEAVKEIAVEKNIPDEQAEEWLCKYAESVGEKVEGCER